MSNVDLDGVDEAHSSEEIISEMDLGHIDYIDVNFSLSKFVPRQLFRHSVAQAVPDSIDSDSELAKKGGTEERKSFFDNGSMSARSRSSSTI